MKLILLFNFIDESLVLIDEERFNREMGDEKWEMRLREARQES